MKKLITILVIFSLVLALSGCGKEEKKADSSASGAARETEEIKAEDQDAETPQAADPEASQQDASEPETPEKEAAEPEDEAVKPETPDQEAAEPEASENKGSEPETPDQEPADPDRAVKAPEASGDSDGAAEEDKEEKEQSDILLVYFSRTGEQYGVGEIETGNTAIVAQMIAEITKADVFEILPEDDYYPYTYDELTEIAKQEQNDHIRPVIKDEVPDLSGYQTVFIGSPVWWGDWPMIMYTFFEENADALAGKTLIPFNTHAGSGLSGFDKKLAAACPGSTVGKGLSIAGKDAQNAQDTVRENVSSWLSGLGYAS